MKVINIDLFKLKKEVEQFKKEDNVLYSEKFKFFLASDNVFDKLDEKYKLSQDDGTYHFNNLVDFIDCHYEEVFVDFFDNTYNASNYTEVLMEVVNDEVDEENNYFGFINSKDWAVTIDETLKSIIVTAIESDLRDKLKKLTEQGYDISISYKSI